MAKRIVDVKIKFEQEKTAFRIINGMLISDDEWERLLDSIKNPFVKIRDLEKEKLGEEESKDEPI